MTFRLPLAAAVWSGFSLTATFAADLPDYRFQVETLLEGVPQPMEIEMAPDGRIFYNEHGGRLKIFDPKTRQVIEAAILGVFSGQENGFLGFALDPKFAENGWIYCMYSPRGFDGQHLSRFKMEGDKLDMASEKVLVKVDEQRKECCHHAGTVEFGPDGLLYFSTGDNTHPHGDSQGYAPIDERPERYPWDAQKSAANTNSLAGKINRIRPKADGTYEIPEGNLFKPGTEKTRPEIYVMGCRNPWRMSVDSKTGYIYWGEVGPDARDDGPRGPRGYDELNQAKKAGYFGWPYFIGNNFAYSDYDYVEKKAGALFDPLKPVNDSPNNTGLKELPPATPAMIYWPYGESREFPEMGEGGRTACAGPVFRYQPEFEKTNGFPKEFDGWLLFWDWERPAIKWAKLDGQSNFQGTEPFTGAIVTANKPENIDKLKPQIEEGATLLQRPVDAFFGPDGCLYVMDYGETWGANKDAKLMKISYVRGNLPPVAKAAADVTAGREPLKVKLTGAASKDHEGDALTYQWKLEPGGQVLGTTPDLETTLAEPGNFRAELTVTDAKGAASTTSVALLVGNTAPVVKFEEPHDGDFFTPGKPVKYRLAIQDVEDGESSARPDDFGFRTLVSSLVLAADGKGPVSDPGLAAIKSSDCFNCHQVEQRIIGPGFIEIADRYRGQAGALDTAVKRVREGSSGVWGPVPMLPHPQHTTDEVAIMLRWVFGLEKGKGGAALVRGLAGEITAPKDAKDGSFLLDATYTDGGRAPAGSLSGKTSVTLRSRRFEAEAGDVRGPKISNDGKASGKKVIGSIADKHFVKFADVNLTEVGRFKVRASSGNVGGTIELRADSPDGELLGSVAIPNTGSWSNWIEKETEPGAAVPAKRTDVYAVFVNPGKGGLMNLDWIEFLPR